MHLRNSPDRSNAVTKLRKTTMALYKYTQTNYFDFSTTASCGGSPIIVTSVGTGCNAALENNEDGKVCTAYGSGGEYISYSTICTANAIDLSSFTRNYVVKSVYVTSDKCEGEPLQAFALAADSMCHMNPSGDNSTAYLKTNCNGGQPIWQECSDAACTNCKTVRYTNSPCQLAGAGSSNKVACYTASKSPGDNGANNGTTKGNSTIQFPVDDNGPNDPFASTASRDVHRVTLPIAIVIFFVFSLLM